MREAMGVRRGAQGAHVRPLDFAHICRESLIIGYYDYYNTIFNVIIGKTLNSLGNYLKLTPEA